MTLTVNGREVDVGVGGTLHDALRRLGLLSVREACGLGLCGSCTVVMDGRLVSSCLVLTGATDGAVVETVEALSPNGELHPLQRAFVDATAFQCSFCTPGFLLAARELLAENPAPSADEVRHYLAGNLCRCGSYLKIEEAVLAAAEAMRD